MNTYSALSDPNRRLILDTVRRNPSTVSMLVEILGISQPAVSKQLRLLREAGLLVVRPEQQRRWYELNVEPLRELGDWLEPYRHLWANRIDALERHLDKISEDTHEQ